MVYDCLPCGLARLPGLLHFHAYGFLSCVIPLNMGDLLLARESYVFGD
jgi:hypothetical protein